jgi:hypothetical protein
MKKFYSIVLMATALLIGTNAWADVNDWAGLKSAIEGAPAGVKTTITLGSSFTAEGIGKADCIWIGTTTENATSKDIVLDLAGKTLTINPAVKDLCPFVLTKGSLKITGSGKIVMTKGNVVLGKGTNVISVFGTKTANANYNPAGENPTPFSHLVIDENVSIETQNGTVIAVDRLVANQGAIAGLTSKPSYTTDGFAFGVRVDVKGSLTSQGAESTADEKKCYGIKVNGLVLKPANEADNQYAPYVHVHPSAVITSDMRSGLDGSTAIYASGFGQWLIEGNCSGATGVYISSGVVVVNDAIVKSTADHNAPGASGHANGSGSAIVINSRSNYQGEVAVTVSGDSKIQSTNGYAFEDVINTKDTNSKVDSISIKGGSFEGGTKGAVSITTATAKQGEVKVNGGNVSGGSSNIGDQSLAEFLNKQGGTHATLVEDENGKTVMVISEGSAPVGYATIAAALNDGKTSVKLTGASDAISGNIVLNELEINEATAQVLTIPANASLTVGRVVLGKYAKIIVKAGANLIVTGEQGIVAPVAENIVIESTADKQGYFLFNPGVTSNRHPNATVQVYTNCYQLTQSPAKTYVRQRLAIPVMETGKPANNFSGEVFPGSGASFLTYAWTWDGSK